MKKQTSASRERAAEIMKDWPRRLELNTLDKLLIAFTLLLIVVLIVRTAMIYPALPDTIPSHFDAAGNVDDYSGKSTIIILSAMGVALGLGLIVCNFFPGAFNVPVSLLKRPAEEIIYGTRAYLNILNIFCVGLFWYILEMTSRIALGLATGMGICFWVILGLIFVATPIFLIWLARG